MRKEYPYLQEQYFFGDWNEEQQKRKFLYKLDKILNQRQYVQITLLDWQENPLKEIQGEISGGSISKDGSSSIRRSCSLSCSVDAGVYSIDSLNMDFALNKKVFVEIGIKNETDEYSDWPILWFPQGIFLITDFSLNSSVSSAVNLNISLKDKMCLLNGDIGGKLPTTVQFDSMDTQSPNGTWIQQKVLIYEIIFELVNHFGGEQISNIVIQDVPLRIKQVMQWNGKNNLYATILTGNSSTDISSTEYIFSTQSSGNTNEITYLPGDDVGYIYKDFVVQNELVGSAGTPITNILDSIKNLLGNYEYFYDVFGIFHFREIKNYLNITQAQVVEEEMRNPGRRTFSGSNFIIDGQLDNQYLIETTNEKTVYGFEDDNNITSITVTPLYSNIKNDYIIEGIRTGVTADIKHIVRYHLAIDNKPEIIIDNNESYYGKHENVIYYTDEHESQNIASVYEKTALKNKVDFVNKLAIVKEIDSFNQLPSIGQSDIFYYIKNLKQTYYWDNEGYKEAVLITKADNGEEIRTSIQPQEYKTKDWRTEFYIQGLEALVQGTDEGNYYFQELEAFWPMEYDLNPNTQRFFAEKNEKDYSLGKKFASGDYFLDFIDANTTALGEYSVQAIGRRQEIVTNDKINCLFVPEIPNVIFLNKDDPSKNWTENTSSIITEEELNQAYIDAFGTSVNKLTKEQKMLALQRLECINNTQPFSQIDSEIFSNLTFGGYANSAYETIRYELFCHTNYQKTVSLTSIPVFYLDVNSRVSLNSKSVNIYGDFMVQSISLTLGPGANMAVTLNEITERL